MNTTPISHHLSWKAAFGGIIACILTSVGTQAEDMRTIEGQIFIRTKGGDNIKLSLVDVLLFDEKVLTRDLEAKRKTAKPVEDYYLPLKKLAEQASQRARNAKEIARTAERNYSPFQTEGEVGKGLQPAVDAVGSSMKEMLAIAKSAGMSLEDDLLPLNRGIAEAADFQNNAKETYERRKGAKEKEALIKAVGGIVKKVSEAAEKTEEQASELLRQISAKASCSLSTHYLFSNLPAAIQTTKTDADGKFSFKVPNGSYVLVSASNRNAGTRTIGSTSFPITERYHWMVKVTADADKKVMLANDNLASAGSAESLVFVLDEGYNIDIQTVAAFVENVKRGQVAAEALAEVARTVQRKTIELYPDLGVADSPLNKEFVERVKIYRIEKKEFFSEPDWPVRLAKECSEALAAKPKAK